MSYIPPYRSGTTPGPVTPFYNIVADYGADPTGSADSSSAFNSAIDDANITGYSIYIPAGSYKLNSALSNITKDGVYIRGEGNWNTEILVNFASGDVITISASNCGIQNLSMQGSAFRTSGYDIVINGGDNCLVRDIFSYYCYNFLWVKEARNCKIEDIYLRYLNGSRGIYCKGTAAKPVYNCQIKHLVADNPFIFEDPDGPEGPLPAVGGVFNQNLKTWNTNTAYAAGDVFKVSGWVFQVFIAGTSGATAPPAPTQTNWGQSRVTNGTMTVRPIHLEPLTWILIDDYTNDTLVLNSALIDGSCAIRTTSSATGEDIYIPGKIIPTGFRGINIEIDHPYDVGVDLQRGYGFHLTMPWIGSVYVGNGIQAAAEFAGDIKIEGGRIAACGQFGILINGGPDFKIDNNFVIQNGVNSSTPGPFFFPLGTFHDIAIPDSANSRGFSIVGNSTGSQKNLFNYSVFTGYGIFINGSSANNFVVMGNMHNASITGSYTIGPTLSSTKIFANNATK
jgi:hypothetical protein